jgi:hypothetical protein
LKALNIIVLVNADNIKNEYMDLLPTIFVKANINVILMGNTADIHINTFKDRYSNIVKLNRQFNTNDAMIYGIKYLRHVIPQEELCTFINIDYAFSYLQLVDQMENIDFDDNFIRLNIYKDLSSLQPVNLNSKRLMQNILLRVDCIQDNDKCILHDHVIITTIKNYTDYLEDKNVDTSVTTSSIATYLEYVGKDEVEACRHGYFLGESSFPSVIKQSLFKPRTDSKVAISKKILSIIFPPDFSTNVCKVGTYDFWVSMFKILNAYAKYKVNVIGNIPNDVFSHVMKSRYDNIHVLYSTMLFTDRIDDINKSDVVLTLDEEVVEYTTENNIKTIFLNYRRSNLELDLSVPEHLIRIDTMSLDAILIFEQLKKL